MISKQNPPIVRLFHFYARLLGLYPFIIKNDYSIELSYLGVAYNFALTITYTWTFVIIIANRIKLHLPRETTLTITMDALALFFQYCTIVAAWIVAIFSRKNLHGIVSGFVSLRESASAIGLDLPHENGREPRRACVRLILINLLYLVIYFADHFSLLDYTDFQKQANSWLFFSLPKLVYYNVYLAFLEIVLVLEDNYRALNRLLLRLFSRGPRDHDILAAHKIIAIGQIHSDLGELLDNVTRYFRLCILCAIMATFIHSFLDIYSLYQLITYGKVWIASDYANFVVILMWLTTKFLGIYFICSIPDAMSAEANYTVVILDRLLNDYSQLKKCKEAIKTLMLQLHQKKIHISIYGMFNLNFYLLRDIVSTSIMCLVFMFQLDDLVSFDV